MSDDNLSFEVRLIFHVVSWNIQFASILSRSLGIHWGTFKLTTEFYLEPRTLLTTFLEKNGIPAADFVTTDIGGSV